MSHRSDSPASSLANLILIEEPAPELVIITGPSGSGKTSACRELIEILGNSGLEVSGVISSSVFDDGRKIAINLIAIHNNDSRPLATVQEGSLKQSSSGDIEGFIRYGRWRFSTDTFAWGNSVLQHLPTGVCIIIDELGPLEFRQNRGLQAGLSLIDRRPKPTVFVVVREELLPFALDRWPWAVVVNFSLDSGGITMPGEAS